jgi:hypothetical protein
VVYFGERITVLPYLLEVEMYQAVKNFFQKTETDPVAAKWSKQCELTPDIWKLEQSQYQLIFIPDSMMQGRADNHLIADAGKDGDVPVHPACFTFDRYTFWQKEEHFINAEGKPEVKYSAIPMKKEYEPTNWLRVRPTPAKIKGQLYAILSPRIIRLDIHKQNGVLFRRERQEISLPYRQVKYNDKPDAKLYSKLPVISPYYLRTVSAWMYIGIPEYWDNLISDMFAVRECNKFELDQPQFWVDEYYKF